MPITKVTRVPPILQQCLCARPQAVDSKAWCVADVIPCVLRCCAERLFSSAVCCRVTASASPLGAGYLCHPDAWQLQGRVRG